jgi:hypothetical protein
MHTSRAQLARILLYSIRTPTGTRRMRARRRSEFRGWPRAGGRMHLRKQATVPMIAGSGIEKAGTRRS